MEKDYVMFCRKIFQWKLIVDYVRQICNGLKEVHNKNIVHRDLQPKNIIVDRHNHITIIDFDIARIRKEEADSDTEFLGTVGYASLSSWFAQTDKRSDIYSLGVLIGDMVKPYAKTVREARRKKLCTPVPSYIRRAQDS